MVLFLSLPISVQIRLVNKPDVHHLIKVVLKVVRNSFAFSIQTELYERLTRL